MSNCVVGCGEVFLLWEVTKYFGGVTRTTLPLEVLPVVQAGLYKAYSPEYIGYFFRSIHSSLQHPTIPTAVCGIRYWATL